MLICGTPGTVLIPGTNGATGFPGSTELTPGMGSWRDGTVEFGKPRVVPTGWCIEPCAMYVVSCGATPL